MGTNRDINEWSRTVAAQIRAERSARKLTQARVIAESGVARSTYIRIETGERVADVSQLARIASVFGMTPSHLLARAESRADDEAKGGE